MNSQIMISAWNNVLKIRFNLWPNTTKWVALRIWEMWEKGKNIQYTVYIAQMMCLLHCLQSIKCVYCIVYRAQNVFIVLSTEHKMCLLYCFQSIKICLLCCLESTKCVYCIVYRAQYLFIVFVYCSAYRAQNVFIVLFTENKMCLLFCLQITKCVYMHIFLQFTEDQCILFQDWQIFSVLESAMKG
jgi:hypothetical protein